MIVHVTIRRGGRLVDILRLRSPVTPEQRCREAIARRPGCRVAWYLILSYLYYERDVSAVPDAFFDQLCVDLLRDLDTIEHPHKHLVDPDALRAGTGHHLVGRFPGIVKSCALSLIDR